MFANVPLVKRPQKFQPPFSPGEVRALLDAQDRDTLTGCRSYALILFLLDTSVRASECIGVELTSYFSSMRLESVARSLTRRD